MEGTEASQIPFSLVYSLALIGPQMTYFCQTWSQGKASPVATFL